MDRRQFALTLAGITGTAALSGCGINSNPLAGGGSPEPDGSAAPGGGGGQAVVVGSADFTESVVLAELYSQALVAKGIESETKTRLGSREVYLTALKDGSCQVVPEYTGNLLQYLDKGNPAQKPEAIVTALQTVVADDDLAVLAASTATDQDVYVVTRAMSQNYGITSIGDLAKIDDNGVLGGPSELQQRPYGPPGLKAIYGVQFASFKPYDSPAVKVTDLNDNKIQAATFFTTEAAIVDNDYVMLTDPQLMILPQQVIPLVAAPIADNADAVAALNAVQAALTTEDLTALNKKVDVEHSDAPTVAGDYLRAKGLA